ncbi:MAG TPA: hypothetical protein VM327_07790 [Candidatus Thermoplasmatota archaeon]|nr:hypothetical protein [Candidatus Thermoplasmatota archaeon]
MPDPPEERSLTEAAEEADTLSGSSLSQVSTEEGKKYRHQIPDPEKERARRRLAGWSFGAYVLLLISVLVAAMFAFFMGKDAQEISTVGLSIVGNLGALVAGLVGYYTKDT